MFPMKTTAKTIFSLMAAGFVLTTINARSLAQSSETSPEKPLSPQIMKILCERSPLNSRCAGSASTEGSSSAPKEEMKEDKKEDKEDKKEEMTPSTSGSPTDPTAPSTTDPASGGTMSPTTPGTTTDPAGGGTLPPTTPGTTPDPGMTPAPATVPAPVEAPSPGTSKPYQSDKPAGPSSALPSVPTRISAEPSSASKSPGSAAELTAPVKTKAPAAGTPSSATPASSATEPATTDKAPSAQMSSPSAEESKPSSAGSEPSAPAPAAETTAPASSGGTVVATVGSNSKLKTLSAAIKAAGLDEALADKGPFTIFAPTDEAFAALPPEALQDLLKPENKAKLAALLTYHVVSGKVESKTLKSGETATVQGQPLTVKVTGSKVMVNDANVTQADVGASNGVIHLIDKVILPSAG
jgi:uncharacterized surface protein with fasciclin (FAS1) repeats